MDILMSIRPEYVNFIRSGKKRVELRKKFPLDIVGKNIYIYESSPIQKIVGKIIPVDIIKYSIGDLWEQTNQQSCITKEKFISYFSNKSFGIAIYFKEFISYPNISLTVIGKKAPQSYCYLQRNQTTLLEQFLQDLPMEF